MGCGASSMKIENSAELLSASSSGKKHQFLKSYSFTEVSQLHRGGSFVSANSATVKSFVQHLDATSALFDAYLSSPQTQKLFIRYIKSSVWLHQLFAKDQSSRKQLTLVHPTSLSPTNKSVKFNQYSLIQKNQIVASADQEEVVMEVMDLMMKLKLKEAEESADFELSRQTLLNHFSSESFQALLIAIALPKFVISDEYRQATASNWIVDMDSVQFSSTNRTAKEKQRDPHRDLKDLCEGVVRVWSESQLAVVISSSKWLSVLGRAIDELSYSITITTYDKDEMAWILEYVNDSFENLTGYKASEVLGRDTQFLQCSQTSRAQAKKIDEAMLHHEPCKVAITYCHKRGYEFCNMLALQPVFDRRTVNSAVSLAFTRSCSRYIGIQYDIDTAGAKVHDLKIIDDLILLLSLVL